MEITPTNEALRSDMIDAIVSASKERCEATCSAMWFGALGALGLVMCSVVCSVLLAGESGMASVAGGFVPQSAVGAVASWVLVLGARTRLKRSFGLVCAISYSFCTVVALVCALG